MGFEILSGADRPMFEGQLIKYNVTPIAGIKVKWVTEITHVRDHEYFVDEQRFGPYALWHHKHFLKEIPNGVLMEDIVDYKVPLGFLGQLVHPFLVEPKLDEIFKYREQKLIELFGTYDETIKKAYKMPEDGITRKDILIRQNMEKNILLIGGSHGIGFELASQLHNDHNVFIASRTAEKLGDLNVTHIKYDAENDELNTHDLPEKLDGFVYCPGSIELKPFKMLSYETFEKDMELNFLSLVKSLKAVEDRLKKSDQASLVFFSTVAVKTGMPFHTSVAAAKGAIEGFAKALAAEYAPSFRLM